MKVDFVKAVPRLYSVDNTRRRSTINKRKSIWILHLPIRQDKRGYTVKTFGLLFFLNVYSIADDNCHFTIRRWQFSL
jgi:hypothetical protein